MAECIFETLSPTVLLSKSLVKKDFTRFRIINITAEESENLDLRMLRSFRVLRPLKLVSRTPSKCGVGLLSKRGLDLSLVTW
ncbi:hypothetical protein CEXT_194691 [Caerostris extrusa]|uniref:Uncharacterized protein n=1 Tax=Caerostris extrusa TaxID=172846 RepID=A0AAV4XFU0_CAEEX|nr:hypothetical protein CEXT_194691 [Caerostris extrusa]